jgi:NodT family efflux transporter outer membrane factor (OMF) lipoprotein
MLPSGDWRTSFLRFAAVLGLGALAGCSVGPDYRAPEIPAVTGYTPRPLPETTVSAQGPGGEAQQLSGGRDLPAEWWAVFQCEALDGLVRQALSESPTLAKAQARLRKAQEDLAARKGILQLPEIDATLAGNRIQVQPESLGVQSLPVDTPFNLYFASLGIRYTLDLFGSSRRELEALRAATDYQRFESEAARLMLAGNVVTSAIREASLREQIATTEEIIALQVEQASITEAMARLGGLAEADVASQRGELARSRAELPALQRQLEQVRHRLAVYVGKPPQTAELPEFHLADLRLPAELPVSVPSELARQRPDIRAAEALLHEASARVGVATANLYPKIRLSADGGTLATTIGSLFSGGTGFYLLAASLAQPLFHGGELRAKKRAAVAAFEQAGAAYQEVLLLGFQNVADILRALEADATILHERSEAAFQARTVFDITSKRYKAGGVSQLALLEAQREYRRAGVAQTLAIADRYADSAALFQALGGGWWNREPLPDQNVKK